MKINETQARFIAQAVRAADHSDEARAERHHEYLGQRLARGLEAERALIGKSGPDVIAYALAVTHGTQADLARASGMTAATIGAIKKGKKPNAAQRAAICWAIATAG